MTQTLVTKSLLTLLKKCLPYIPHDGDQERDLREAIEDALKANEED